MATVTSPAPLLYVRTTLLDVAYETHGPIDGEPVILLHGFPYDPRGYDDIAPVLAERGYRVLVPALWPQRVRGLVTGDGYNIQAISQSLKPRPPETEHRLWYQYYFHTQRGVDGLTANRRELCQLLWTLWSPSWAEGPSHYALTAPSFDNPDFVEVVIHSYRHRFMYAPGDPALEYIEQALVPQPPISVPSISLCGADDGVGPPSLEDDDVEHFSGFYRRQVLPGVGHNVFQEAPQVTLQALLELLER